MSNAFLDEQRNIYRHSFVKFGDTPEGLLMNNRETQYLRFERLLRNFNIAKQPFTIHDIGCGTCDLQRYFHDLGIKDIKRRQLHLIPAGSFSACQTEVTFI